MKKTLPITGRARDREANVIPYIFAPEVSRFISSDYLSAKCESTHPLAA